jgi:hypothetical protein
MENPGARAAAQMRLLRSDVWRTGCRRMLDSLMAPSIGFLLGSWRSLSWTRVANWGLAKVTLAVRRPVAG